MYGRNYNSLSLFMWFCPEKAFWERWSCFKFNDSGLTLGKALKYYSSIVKGSKQKVRKFWELISVFENQGKN